MEPPVGSSSVAESGVVQPIPRKNVILRAQGTTQ